MQIKIIKFLARYMSKKSVSLSLSYNRWQVPLVLGRHFVEQMPQV
jgi:hypothetical protein